MSTISEGRNTLVSCDGKFKIGDKVETIKDMGVPYEKFRVMDIFTDSWGSVLLKSKKGFGYGSHYCRKVNRGG